MKNSVLNNDWKILEENYSKALFFEQSCNLPLPIAKILSLKNNLDATNVEDFLTPMVKNLMPNPFDEFLDIDVAVLRILKAIKYKHNIVIFGDYDVDGATSSAILKRFFKMIGVESTIYIPDRIKEGYGPNTNALLELRKQGADLVITVDCGTVAFEPLLKANEAGLDIIVIDHHLGIKEKPKSVAIINPNRFDETSNLGYLCGAGVTFMLVVALNMTLKKNGFYNQEKQPNLLSLLDLVALGTVCDIMPLVGLNRAFVKTGLEVIKKQTNLGIKTLLAIAGRESEISEFTLGFILGPRINAGGRIGKSNLGANLLSTQSPDEAFKIATELDNLNSNRKQIEESSLFVAIEKIESLKLAEKEIIFVEDEAFHQGIIGILASRIKDRYNKPVAVFSRLEGYLKASLRSVQGLDLGSIIHKANQNNLLIAGGGHAMAGGVSVLDSKYNELFNFFNQEITNTQFDFKNTLYASSLITIKAVNINLCNELKRLAPFGNANEKPLFLIQNAIVIKCDILKEAHISLILKDKISGHTIKAMMFKALQLGILPYFKNITGKEVDVIGEIELNEWNGSQFPILHLKDIAF